MNLLVADESKEQFPLRLKRLLDALGDILDTHRPDEVAIERVFVARNPDFSIASVGIRASNGGWLREIQICYGKDFMPRACDARQFGPKNDVPLKIWRGL